MAKRKPKSLTSFASKMPAVNLDEIEADVSKVHGESRPEDKPALEKPEPVLPKKVKPKAEKNIRVTVDTPKSVHTTIKRIILDLDQETDLRSFYLKAVKEKCERLGYPVDK